MRDIRSEDKYRSQMEELGLWQEAFAPEVHTLCMLERELRRAQKRQPDLEGKTAAAGYQVILQLRRDILAHREALGLTPRALRRLRGASPAGAGGGGVEELLAGLDDGGRF